MEKEKKPELPIEFPDSMRNGVFATYFSITVNPEFAVIDFGSPLPEPGTGSATRNRIVARIITTKAGVKELANLLNGLIKQSESS